MKCGRRTVVATATFKRAPKTCQAMRNSNKTLKNNVMTVWAVDSLFTSASYCITFDIFLCRLSTLRTFQKIRLILIFTHASFQSLVFISFESTLSNQKVLDLNWLGRKTIWKGSSARAGAAKSFIKDTPTFTSKISVLFAPSCICACGLCLGPICIFFLFCCCSIFSCFLTLSSVVCVCCSRRHETGRRLDGSVEIGSRGRRPCRGTLLAGQSRSSASPAQQFDDSNPGPQRQRSPRAIVEQRNKESRRTAQPGSGRLSGPVEPFVWGPKLRGQQARTQALPQVPLARHSAPTVAGPVHQILPNLHTRRCKYIFRTTFSTRSYKVVKQLQSFLFLGLKLNMFELLLSPTVTNVNIQAIRPFFRQPFSAMLRQLGNGLEDLVLEDSSWLSGRDCLPSALARMTGLRRVSLRYLANDMMVIIIYSCLLFSCSYNYILFPSSHLFWCDVQVATLARNCRHLQVRDRTGQNDYQIVLK